MNDKTHATHFRSLVTMSFQTNNIHHQTQQASTNLDQDLSLSRDAKYQRSQQEVSQWIFEALALPADNHRRSSDPKYDLIEMLKDGWMLCKLGDLLGLETPTKKFKNSKMPFVQMENIMFFLQTCELIGVTHDEIFQTVDLFERKDPYQVIVTLMAFSRKANEINPSAFPKVIGPKVLKVKPPVPHKPIALRK